MWFIITNCQFSIILIPSLTTILTCIEDLKKKTKRERIELYSIVVDRKLLFWSNPHCLNPKICLNLALSDGSHSRIKLNWWLVQWKWQTKSGL